MEPVQVQLLITEDGEKEYVFFEQGNYSKPIMLLSEAPAVKLFNQLYDLINASVIKAPKLQG